MGMFRFWLVFVFLVISVYTLAVISQYGVNLFPFFFGDMMKMGWAGQFNLDFMFMLVFSAMWTAWRNEFSTPGLGLAVLAFFFGAPFLCLYLFYLSREADGDLVQVLIGNRAASRA